MRRHIQFLRTCWDALRTSFWFLPALMGLVALVMAAVAPSIDGSLGTRGPWFVYVSAPEDARNLLGNLFSSMITMASLVFSITMVVLTLAASQFGPRLIRTFMASRRTQLVLGTYVMTITFCLLCFASIGWRQGEEPFPYLSVTFAIALTLLSVALLIVHIHALARSIMSETIIGLVGRELDDGIEDLVPLGEGPGDDPEAALPDDFAEKAARSGLRQAGYIQAIEFAEIVRIAQDSDVLVGLYFRAGDYVIEGGKGIGIYPTERAGPDLHEAIARTITVGTHRTPAQDLEFSVRHLVEIAVRALSPGVNDPYTAAAVINQLSASLGRLMNRELPRGVFSDAEGTMRVICERPTYASLLGASFHQIRQNGGDKPLILIHLLDAIERIASRARTESQREALREELRRVSDTAEREIDDPADLATIRKRALVASRALDDLDAALSS